MKQFSPSTNWGVAALAAAAVHTLGTDDPAAPVRFLSKLAEAYRFLEDRLDKDDPGLDTLAATKLLIEEIAP